MGNRGRPRKRKRQVGAFGRRLLAARQVSGLSQVALAERLEIAWRTLVRYELGERVPFGPARRFIEAWIDSILMDTKESRHGKETKPFRITLSPSR